MVDLKQLEEKRKEVLKVIKPICDYFNIEYDYIIKESGQTETLVLDGQKIGCSANSISAIIEEVIGYVFVNYYCKNRWWYHKPQTIKAIKKYWYS